MRWLYKTDRIGRPYQFFTVGGPIETERMGIGWHWFGYGNGNWCSLNSTSDFLINWFFIGHGHGDWHGDWYWNGHSVNVPLSDEHHGIDISKLRLDYTLKQIHALHIPNKWTRQIYQTLGRHVLTVMPRVYQVKLRSKYTLLKITHLEECISSAKHPRQYNTSAN